MTIRNFGFLGHSFQLELMKVIIEDRTFASIIIEYIESSYFDNIYVRYIMQLIKEHFIEFNKIPTYETLQYTIKSETNGKENPKTKLGTLDEIIKLDYNKIDVEFIKLTTIKFCKQQVLNKEIKKVQKIIDNGSFEDYDKIEEIIRKAIQVGVNTNDVVDVFHDIESALEEEARRPIPLGIDGIDNILMGGLSKGELGVVIAPTGVGKSLPDSEPILKINGWTPIGKVKIGDKIVGSDGKEQYVTGVYPQGERPIYKVQFTDNTYVNCDEEHLWSVNTLNMRTSKKRKQNKTIYTPNNNYITMKTSEMMRFIKKRGRYNYRLPNIDPVDFEKKDILIDPYLMGLLLGDGYLPIDGSCNISTKDDEIFENIKHLSEHTSFNEYSRNNNNNNFTIKRILFKKTLNNKLLEYNLLGTKSNNKFIHKNYLYNSLDIRISLLQGLMDTDGYVSKKGIIQFTTVSEQLSKDVRELILSLGGTVRVNIKNPIYTYKGIKKEGQKSFVLTISFGNNIVPFKILRKVDRYKKRIKYINQKFVKSITYSHNENATCIKVSNSDELFVTRDYVLTHNTTLLTKFANSAFNNDFNVLQIYFEDNTNSIKQKHFTIWSGYPSHQQKSNKKEVEALVNEAKKRSNGKLLLHKMPSDTTTVSHIKSKIRKLIAEGFKPDLVLIDYVDCIVSEKAIDSGDEWKGEGHIMRQLESMTNEFDVAVWVATQGNRSSIGSEVVTSDQMSGSIKKAMIGHVILSIGKTLEQKEHKIATMSVLKSRIGPDGMVFTNCTFDNEYLKIDTDEVNTFLGFKEEKDKEKTARAAEAYRLKKEKEEKK